MTEASTKSVVEKLRYAPSMRAAILNAPPNYIVQFQGELHERLDGQYDFLQVFATRRDDLLQQGPLWKNALKQNGIFWLSYPKGKIVPTDLNRDIVRTTLEQVGLEVVSQVAVDEVWSALRAKHA